MSLDDIKSALTNLKEVDLEKLADVVRSLAAEDLQKLKDTLFPKESTGGKAKSEGSKASPENEGGKASSESKAKSKADLDPDRKYVQSSGLPDTINGLWRCAVKMKPVDLNKFGADYFSGELEKQKRLVLVSSNTPDLEKFKACVRERGDMGAPILTSVWDWEAKPEDLVGQIQGLCKEHGPFKTIAFCCHGGAAESAKEDIEGFKWHLLEKCGVQIGAGGESDKGAEEILQALADAAAVRLDLLACDLAASKVGLQWINDWEKKIGKNVAASTDITGNTQSGGNWVLETDGINVAQVYFKQAQLRQFGATFGWFGFFDNSDDEIKIVPISAGGGAHYIDHGAIADVSYCM